MSHNPGNPSQSSRVDRSEQHPENRAFLLTAGVSAIGSALCLYAFSRRNKSSAALAALGLVAMTQASRQSEPSSYKAHASFLINCSPEEAYRFWRDFENLPRFMQYLDSVKVTGNNRSEWTALGPMNTKFHWTAEIIEERANERIAWRSVAGSEVQAKGSVEFRAATNGRGTMAIAKVEYTPPGGALRKAFAAIMGKDPKFTVREDLRKFKALIEAGEIPTTKGQPHGPRGLQGRAQEMLLRENQSPASMHAQESMRPAV